MYRRQRPTSCSKFGYEKATIMSRLVVDCLITIDNRFAVWRRCNSSQISNNNYSRRERKSQLSKTSPPPPPPSSSIRRTYSQDVNVSREFSKWNVVAAETCGKRTVNIFLSTTSSLDEGSIPEIRCEDNDVKANERQHDEENDVETDNATATPPESCRSEKKVTFASDVLWQNRRKMTAETRRQQFRNSKITTDGESNRQSKNSFNLYSGSINGGSRAESPVNGGGGQKTFKQRIVSVENAADVDDDDDAAERPTSGCATISSAATPANSSTNASIKPITATSAMAKRKLKSCRSRSFHKSLDSSSTMTQSVNTTAFTYVKPSKSNHHDVVTMVSLLNSNEDATTTDADVETQKRSDNTTVSRQEATEKFDPVPLSGQTNDIKLSTIRESRSKSGILKAKLPNDRGPLPAVANCKEGLKLFRTLTAESTKTAGEKSKISHSWTSVDIVETVNTDNSNRESYEHEFSALENQNEIGRNLQSRKEQECWLSFRKMTNKGMFVSFDTILRGLLTPTEYRLRKTELLGQE